MTEPKLAAVKRQGERERESCVSGAEGREVTHRVKSQGIACGRQRVSNTQ